MTKGLITIIWPTYRTYDKIEFFTPKKIVKIQKKNIKKLKNFADK